MKLKRFAAPRTWPIARKINQFVIALRPGTHPKSRSLPLAIVLRDILHCAQTVKEVRDILNKNLVKVDGKVRRDHRFPVGLMDVLSVGDEYYRILPDQKGLFLKRIDREEAKIKLSMIKNKSCLKGKIQLNLHDGKNIIVKKDDYKTGDVLVLDFENGIKEILKFEKGATALITGGHNIGSVGKIEKIIITKSPQPNQISLIFADKKVTIPKNYVFVVGKEKPVIELGDDK